MIALVLAACGGSETEDDPPASSESDGEEENEDSEATADDEPVQDEPVELRFVNWASAEESTRDSFQEAVDQCEANVGNIEVTLEGVPFSQMAQTLLTQAAGGNPPDVAQMAQNMAFQLGSAGFLVDLEAAGYADEEFMADNFASAVDAGRLDGELIVAPWVQVTHGFWYNKDVLEQAGLDPDQPAQTMDELREHIQVIGDELGDSGVFGIGLNTSAEPQALFHFYPFFLAFGAQPLAGGPNFDTDGVVEALEFAREAVAAGHSPQGSNVGELRELAARGRLGYFLDGPFGVGIFRSLNPELEGDAFFDTFGVTAFPEGTNGAGGTLANLHQLGIFSASDHPDEAWEFAQCMISSETSVVDYQLPLGVIPSTESALGYPEMEEFLDNPITSAWPDVILPQQVPGPYGPLYGESVESVVTGMQRVVIGGEDAPTVTAETEERLDAIWAD